MPMPSFGYCYTLEGYPRVEPMFELRERRSQVFPAVSEESQVIAGKDAGYLFRTVAS